MVGIVVVSHSASLAGGVVELAREMAGESRVEAAGGLSEPAGAIGTDATLVLAAIERADAGDGVLVLMDLGSAVMSAELAVEMWAGDAGDVVLCEAPLVEGAIAAAARAAGGAGLAEVAEEARAALAMKAAQLGVAGGDPAADHGDAPAGAGKPATGEAGAGLRLIVANRLGLHARPAARVVAALAGLDARVTVADQTTGGRAVDARSLTALLSLGAREGHVIAVHASGPQAAAALEALRELADSGFGDGLPVPDDVGSPAPDGVDPRERDGVHPRLRADEAGAPLASAPGPERVAPARRPANGALLEGTAASPGIAIGPARVARGAEPESAAAAPAAGSPEEELERLEAALRTADSDLSELGAATATRAGEEAAAIFDAQRLLLQDSALLEPARHAIAARGARAQDAWREATAATARSLARLADAYLRERAGDVRDVGGRVVALLTQEARLPVESDGILVARDVTPGQVAALDPDRVRGLAVAGGGATSHAAILARALGIPAVMGLGEDVLAIADGTDLVVDGSAGTVEVDPGRGRLAARERDRVLARERAAHARARAREPAVTRDGNVVEVLANVGDASEIEQALELGAEGVGLLRTEFLFLDRRTAPEEEEQRDAYERIARALQGRPLVIRTLDAGADKPLAYLEQEAEENPYLGVRGIRLALARPWLLRTQLRAIAAVAVHHPLSVMLPMVSSLDELRAARGMLSAALDEVGAARVPLGIMVEVPAVALMAERFAAEADFFSIGTNDLAQYTMAAERGHARLGPLLHGASPGLLELIARVVRAGRERGRRVAVCGELAGAPETAALLTGLGVRELSMAPSLIPDVKEALRALDAGAAAKAASEARGAENGHQAAALGRRLVDAAGPVLGR